jgi:hypothetical protein
VDGQRPADHGARRSWWTGAILLAAGFVLYGGLLVLERSGPSPVQRVSESPAPRSVVAASGPVGAATIFGQTPKFTATISGAAPVSQITTTGGGPVEVICQQFIAGTAITLSTVEDDTKGMTISKVITPGQFLYWVNVQATSGGPQSFTITQSTTYNPSTGSPFFLLGGGTAVFDASCNSVAASTSGGTADNPNVTVSFTAPSAGSFDIGVKFMTHSIIGSSPASTTSGFSYTYTFATVGVGGSTQTVSLTHL